MSTTTTTTITEADVFAFISEAARTLGPGYLRLSGPILSSGTPPEWIFSPWSSLYPSGTVFKALSLEALRSDMAMQTPSMIKLKRREEIKAELAKLDADIQAGAMS